ncbi:uncharacterized protein A1O9_12380 [Exophiala aquamarina CBS 119918]|uniref:1-acylglycerone phosphate reductase n=1 Tax=Exophiala aquamarina CBS 119918 TaxID=1182545 RepID=A0A072NWN9_9EURO|nr:uncharacterized protein A1O9_12380 [Exophiala aquamarina CBS 119918]KEF51463.1 hypothetical protein A1O9_12380 [Exophiala aquamarina CBS 119918]
MAAPRKTVLITGCSAGGIGGGLAEAFLEKGYFVFAGLRTPSKASQILSQSKNVKILTLDVLSSESIASAVESVSKETAGKLDILVNNSGAGILAPALDTSIKEGKALFDLNFWAPVAMVQAFAPLLVKAKGCIVNNTSANSQVPMPFMSMYNASKGALAMASETWRLELQPLGVRVMTLVTLGVKTNSFANAPQHEIPETSNYYDIRDFIHGLSDGRLQASGVTTKRFATQVVHQVDKGASGTVWAGGNSSLVSFTWWILPQSLRVRLFQYLF